MSDASKPWMLDPDWSVGLARSRVEQRARSFTFFAIAWWLFSAPALFVGIPQVLEQGRYWVVVLIALFPIAGCFLAYTAVKLTLRERRYGESTLQLRTLPGVIGGYFEAELRSSGEIVGAQWLHATLSNVRQRRSKANEDASKLRKVRWQRELRIPGAEVRQVAGGTQVSLRFAIPFEAAATDPSLGGESAHWTLAVWAEAQGVDYEATFDVPVFRTEASDPHFDAKESEDDLDEAPVLDGVHFEEGPGWLRLRTRPFRRWRGAAIAAVAALACGMLAGGLFLEEGAGFFAWVLGAIAGISFVAAVNLLLQSTALEIADAGVRIERTWLGLGRVYTIDRDRIRAAHLQIASQSNSDVARPKLIFGIALELDDGTRLATRPIGDRQLDAARLVRSIEAALGLE